MYIVPKDGIDQKDDDLKKEIDQYIQLFIDGELLITDANYFNFQKQKELFI